MGENHLVFAYPGDLATPTGGYGYDRRVIAGLEALGWGVDLLGLGDGFPFPSRVTLDAAEAALQSLAKGTRVVVDGLAFGAMPEIAARLAGHLDLVVLLHHPLCLENGLTAKAAASLKASEEAALRHASHVIVTSHATAAQVSALFSYPPEKITVILPGTDRPHLTASKKDDGPVRLLAVGTVVERKGYDLLFKALADLRDLDWHLDIVGGLGSDPACYQALVTLGGDLAFGSKVTFHGAVTPEALPEFYKDADIFALASRYEGYGMAYAEAISYGLPVIGSGAGAVRETLPEGASIYCGVEDVDALRSALNLVLSDPETRRAMAAAAMRAANELPTWDDAAASLAETLKGLGA